MEYEDPEKVIALLEEEKKQLRGEEDVTTK